MNNTDRESLSPAHLIKILREHPWRWLGPALVIGALATLYAAVRPDTWAAQQALIVRNVAVANREGPGQFDHADQMKTLQETILEVARSREVLRAALTEVGSTEDNDQEYLWPSDDDIDKIRRSLEVTPPQGAEFGTTEIFYLTVKDHDRRRAVALAEAVCDQLQRRLKSIRDSKARSMEAELVKVVTLARENLEESTVRLAKIEREAGSDLVELRVLTGSTSGESSLRRTSAEIQNELRTAQSSKNANLELLGVLKAAQGDAGVLMAAPNRLFETQPSLKRLKDGLVDSQLETAKLRGSMQEEHPAVKAAIEEEKEIGRHLHNELAIAVRGLKADIKMDSDRIALLGERLENVDNRLKKLADIRARYANLIAETANRSQLLEQAEQDLARARASRAGADAASLISRVGDPDTGSRPVGPGRAMTALFGIAAGLFAGFGLVLLRLEPSQISIETSCRTQAATVDENPPDRGSSDEQVCDYDAYDKEFSCPAEADDIATLSTIKIPGEKLVAAGRTSISKALQKLSS